MTEHEQAVIKAARTLVRAERTYYRAQLSASSPERDFELSLELEQRAAEARSCVLTAARTLNGAVAALDAAEHV
jgi:hypothetical protein